MAACRQKQRGIGLAETLIAGLIGAIVLFGAMRMLKISSDGQHRADVKNDLQNFEDRIRNLLGDDPETCKAVLVDPLPNRVFDPTNLADFNEDPKKSSAALRLSDGTILKSESSLTSFRLARLSLRLIGAVPPDTNGRYEAVLDIDPDTRLSGRMLAGGELRNRQLPLILTTTYDSVAKKRTIDGCSLRNASGKEMCEGIGGRWLSSMNRCFFGGDLKLNQFECVDASEFEAGGPLEGAIVQECYYRLKAGSARMSTYTCYNFPNPKYPRCLCQPGDTATGNGWQLRRPKGNQFIRPCDAGVLIKVPDEKTIFLQDNEVSKDVRIGSEEDEVPPPVTLAQTELNDDILDSVLNCHYEDISSSMRAFRCPQGDAARLGQKGACVFVNGSRASDGKTWIENFTGWLLVTTPRSLVLQGTGSNQYYAVQEAQGRRCDFVQVVEGAEGSLTTSFTDLNDPAGNTEPGTNVLTDPARFRDLQECVFLGGGAGDHVPVPKSVKPFRGAYLNRYPCHNDDVDTANLAGDGVDNNPSLNRGTCWYFQDVKLSAAFSANWVPGRSGGKYTGWAYLRADLPEKQFEADPATLVVKPQSGKSGTLNAVPCNLGVRLPK